MTDIKLEISTHFYNVLERNIDDSSLQNFLELIQNSNIALEDIKKLISDSPEAQVSKSQKFMKYAPQFKTSYSDEDVQKMLKSVSYWYHSFRFGNVSNSSTRTSLNYQMWVSQNIPLNLKGKSVLDIGAYDGFYSFLCESRGAERVLAIDIEAHDDLSTEKTHSSGFQICKKILNSKVEYKKMSVYDLDLISETFDLVLFFGIYYHLANPVLGFEKILPKVNDALFVAGHVLDTQEPIMRYSKDHNWWVASPQCLLKIGKRLGFKDVEILDTLLVSPNTPLLHLTKFSASTNRVGLFKFSK